MVEIQVILPVYNEGKQILQNIRTIVRSLKQANIPQNLILVDDGSSDDTWEKILLLEKEIPNLKGLRFSRNFGKEAAIWAGLEMSNSQAVIVMDSDLQHPPDLIPTMYGLWKEKNFEVVEGLKANRPNEAVVTRSGAVLFYRIFYLLSGYDLNGASDFKLLDRKVVSNLLKLSEHHVFFRGLSGWVGFKKASIPFFVPDRKGSQTKWSFFRLCKLAITAITAFSSSALQLVTIFGGVFFVGALLIGIRVLYIKFSGRSPDGFTTLIFINLITGGLLMLSLGIIGLYLGRIFDEVKRRPRYIRAASTEDISKFS